jgi:hypothetical protein
VNSQRSDDVYFARQQLVRTHVLQERALELIGDLVDPPTRATAQLAERHFQALGSIAADGFLSELQDRAIDGALTCWAWQADVQQPDPEFGLDAVALAQSMLEDLDRMHVSQRSQLTALLAI